ncbi:IS91 family transposase [Gimesia benthica]|uniref:IS91 family transposase n=1 Tax=Gimesia benthica TaxID=2608982 RepID=A0A6I6AGL2_9PLAN|nr:IS91 family transposase [Gimesia benthica]QGQ25763.1 IS91 family transposase [Gimesia benthica]
MTRPRWELADVVRKYGAEYLKRYTTSVAQRRVMRALQNCRTAVLGGHVETCRSCDHRQISYNSCRNRHCPKCQGSACALWMQRRATELLPVPYFHVVFTLPNLLVDLTLANPRLMYGMLFRAASQTLLEVAADPRHLGAEIGFLAVLHTWGQTLMPHPHLHCVVPSGGLAPDRTRWIAGRADFFLPVRVLSRLFRGKFLDLLKQAYVAGKLKFPGRLASAAAPQDFKRLLNRSVRTEWVVYARPPFGGPEAVLKYLARYTHRVAISNSRLLNVADGQVTFRYKDYAQGSRKRTMTLAATEFLRRFLQHVLPDGLMRIRHYGFLANRFRAEKIALCRGLLEGAGPLSEKRPRAMSPVPGESSAICPSCGQAALEKSQELPSRWERLPAPYLVRASLPASELWEVCDTS